MRYIVTGFSSYCDNSNQYITRQHSGLENAVKSNQRNGPDRSHDPGRPAGKIYHNIKISAVEGGNRKGVLYEF